MKEIVTKLLLHTLPWEIDNQHLVFDRMRNSLAHIDAKVKISIDACLNLSDAIIDWEKSTLPKQYFIDRFNVMEYYFKNLCETKFYVYTGSDVYGHLNVIKESYRKDIDYYIGICPDIDFNEYLISHLITAAQSISNKYFVISPQIYKCWDYSWDGLVNEKFINVPYEQCLSKNSNEIVKLIDNISIEKIDAFKFAGWMDIYNKNFYEKLAPVLDSWNGYGPLDLYAMNVCKLAKNFGVDVQQYILKNQVVWSTDSGGLKNDKEYGGDGKFKSVYNKYICKKMNRQEQRAPIDLNMKQLLEEWKLYYYKNLK
jgi:hypothetical protein